MSYLIIMYIYYKFQAADGEALSEDKLRQLDRLLNTSEKYSQFLVQQMEAARVSVPELTFLNIISS